MDEKENNRDSIGETEREFQIAGSYCNIIEIAKKWMNSGNETTKEEQIMLLGYLINSILDDMCSSIIVEPLMKPDTVNGMGVMLFPEFFYDENGNRQTVVRQIK